MANLLINFSIYFNFFINLFILVNPIGVVPIFSTITKGQTEIERSKTNFLTNFSVFLILSITVFLGNIILHFLGISLSSFRIAGGILIIGIALSMMNETSFSGENNKINAPKKIAIVPLAIPLIAGPGAISSTIIWSEQYPNFLNHFCFVLVILLFSFLCWSIFKLSPCINSIFGKESLKVITKIMSLLLMSMGIEFITLGIKEIILNI